MSRRRKPRDGSSQPPARGNFDPSTAPGRWQAGPTAPRRPYAGPGGRGQHGRRQDDWRRGRHAPYQPAVEDTSPSRYSRSQQRTDRPRPPRARSSGPPPRHRHARDGSGRPAPPPVPAGATIDPFDLFCAYHLGITHDGGYRIQNIHEVARRFGTNAGALKQTLIAYGMGADDIVHSGFDLPGAQLDIMVAPEGISRRELARPLYAEFKAAPRQSRDWTRELEEAEREIARTIGADGRWSPGPRDAGGKQ